jgi:hypothetical protein
MTKSLLAAATLLPCLTAAQIVPAPNVDVNGMNTLFGPTGLITVPTAYVTPRMVFNAGATFADGIRGPSVNYGLVDWVEVGIAWLDADGVDDKVILNAKATILPENFKWLDIGVGVIDAFDSIEDTLYLIASARLTTPDVSSPTNAEAVGLKVHVGYGSGMFSNHVIGGGELTFSDRFSLIGEWDGHDVNGAVRFVPNDTFRIQAGFAEKKFFLGMTSTVRL